MCDSRNVIREFDHLENRIRENGIRQIKLEPYERVNSANGKNASLQPLYVVQKEYVEGEDTRCIVC